MKLPIRNNSSRTLSLILEPLGEDHEVPAGGQAIVTLEDGLPHSIDVHDDFLKVWDEGGECIVEVASTQPF